MIEQQRCVSPNANTETAAVTKKLKINGRNAWPWHWQRRSAPVGQGTRPVNIYIFVWVCSLCMSLWYTQTARDNFTPNDEGVGRTRQRLWLGQGSYSNACRQWMYIGSRLFRRFVGGLPTYCYVCVSTVCDVTSRPYDRVLRWSPQNAKRFHSPALPFNVVL